MSDHHVTSPSTSTASAASSRVSTKATSSEEKRYKPSTSRSTHSTSGSPVFLPKKDPQELENKIAPLPINTSWSLNSPTANAGTVLTFPEGYTHGSLDSPTASAGTASIFPRDRVDVDITQKKTETSESYGSSLEQFSDRRVQC